jgi:hypothetical protein
VRPGKRGQVKFAGGLARLRIGDNTAAKTTLDVRGGVSIGWVAKTGAYTMTGDDGTVRCDATSGAFTITLPAATNIGQIIFVRKTDASANAVTVAGAGSDTIEGAASVSLANQYDRVALIADGTGIWYRILTKLAGTLA